MTSNSAFGSRPRNRIDRRNAPNVTCGLAAMRRVTLRKVGKDDRLGPPLYSKTDMLFAAADARSGREMSVRGQWTAGTAKRSTVAFDGRRRARTVAEIEHAFVALQRTAPAPEQRPQEVVVIVEPRKRTSVWTVLGGIWLSTIVIAGGALTAMVYLLR
jgi:hypothetical protein